MSKTVIPERTIIRCDRCQVEIGEETRVKRLTGLVTVTEIVERTSLRWTAATVGVTIPPQVLQSDVHFCAECWEDWSLFLQGREVPAKK